MALDITTVRILHTHSGKNYIRATHIPTGISVQTEGEGYFKTKAEALELLEKEVAKK